VSSKVVKHTTEYNTRKKVDAFVFVYTVCDEFVADYVVARPCRANERVYMKPRPDSYDFTYVYEYLFKEYNITFQLTDFEAGMLNVMNIPPSQLHPNSLTFLKCFDLVLGIWALIPQ